MDKRSADIFALQQIGEGIDNQLLALADDQEYHGLTDFELRQIQKRMEAFRVRLNERVYRLRHRTWGRK